MRTGSASNVLNSRKVPLCLMLLCLCVIYGEAQQRVDFTYQSIGIENNLANVIQNADHLNDFFENLYQQRSSNDRKINIIHIGDSHIQGDHMTAIIRRYLQHYFGNAGRGLIVPYRVAGTNEPHNIYSESGSSWRTRRLVQREIPIPLGISGISLQSQDTSAGFTLKMKDPWHHYYFNQVKLFVEKNESTFDFTVYDTLHRKLAFIRSADQPENFHFVSASLSDTTSAIALNVQKTTETQKQATIFGLSLENGNNGILYHCIGVNGAKYELYNTAEYFVRQTSALTPQLFIISLGTNESAAYPSIDRNFLHHVHRLVNELRNQNPQAQFILTTPPGAFRKKNRHNPAIETIRSQIIQYAVENGLAFYDLYKVIGAENAATKWSQAGLLRPDGIHFTIQGYEYQGELFVNGFIKSYNQYVSVRHQ